MPDPKSPYSRPPRLLLVTDYEWLALSMETLFAPRGYDVRRAATQSQALEQVREVPPDVIIIGRNLRDANGLDLCRKLRQDSLVSLNTAIMLLAPSPWDRDDTLAALTAGAWETAVLPLDAAALFLRVDAWARAKLSSDGAVDQGLLDAHSGLYNANGLLRRMAELGATSQRHHRPLACLVLQSESYSSGSADEDAAATADAIVRLLRSLARSSDAVGRLSANEFVIIAPETDGPGVLGMAARLVHAAAAGKDSDMRIRCGCYAADDFADASIAPTEMLIRAAEALRRATDFGEPVHLFGSARSREFH